MALRDATSESKGFASWERAPPLPPEPLLWYPSASGGTDLRTRH